jgi:hypothetical protein
MVKWRNRGRPKALYPDMSCKDAHVYPELPVPNGDCGISHVSLRPQGMRTKKRPRQSQQPWLVS